MGGGTGVDKNPMRVVNVYTLSKWVDFFFLNALPLAKEKYHQYIKNFSDAGAHTHCVAIPGIYLTTFAHKSSSIFILLNFMKQVHVGNVWCVVLIFGYIHQVH